MQGDVARVCFRVPGVPFTFSLLLSPGEQRSFYLLTDGDGFLRCGEGCEQATGGFGGSRESK